VVNGLVDYKTDMILHTRVLRGGHFAMTLLQTPKVKKFINSIRQCILSAFGSVYQMFNFRRITLFCLEKRFSKHKMAIFSKNWGGHGSIGLAPPLENFLRTPLIPHQSCMTQCLIFFALISYYPIVFGLMFTSSWFAYFAMAFCVASLC